MYESVAVRAVRSPSVGEVVQSGNAAYRVVDAIALETAIAQDLPGLHPSEGMLDPSADLAVGGVVFFFPVRQFALPRVAAVRDDEPGTSIAAVGNHRGVPDGGLRPGKLLCLAVVAVARQRSADQDDEPSVGVDNDLVIHRVPVVLIGHRWPRARKRKRRHARRQAASLPGLVPPRTSPCRAKTFGSFGTLISRLRPVPSGRTSDQRFSCTQPADKGHLSAVREPHELSSRPRPLSAAGDTNG